jgi:hypothetical protein
MQQTTTFIVKNMKENIKADARIFLRVPSGEKQVFATLAKESGLALSAWMKLTLRQSSIEQFKTQGKPNPFLPLLNDIT